MMLRLSIPQMIDKINQELPFHAVAEDYSFTIKIDNYVHYVCAAIHDGHQFRKDLWKNCLHTEYDRWQEEDPCTKEFIASHPIVIAGRDSRFEYDLNRDPDNAIYEDAWGKKLWKTPLTDAEKKRSLDKHLNFYKVVDALILKLQSKYNAALVYDMHSYNWQRWDREVPVINLGTTNINNQKFGEFVSSWISHLSGITLPNGLKTTYGINDTFQGNGYFLKYISAKFKDTLVLATEFSKIYGDELNYIIYPEVVSAIKNGLDEKIPLHAEEFFDKYSK